MTRRDVVLAGILEWMPIPNRWKQELWSLLPDYCENPECSRRGVRGNENVVGGHVLCDNCSVGLGEPVD